MGATYPKPSVTVDCVVIRYAFSVGRLQVLLIERGVAPFKGAWALPGGFVEMAESLDHAAARELREETDLRDVYLEQLYAFGAPKRDPRDRVISVAYLALLRPQNRVEDGGEHAKGGDDAKRAEWKPLSDAHDLKLAFDHKEILQKAHDRLRSKIRDAPVLFDLLPAEFTIPQAQDVYEAVVGQKVDVRHFRRKLEDLGALVDTGWLDTGRRPARLYEVDRKALAKRTDFRL